MDGFLHYAKTIVREDNRGRGLEFPDLEMFMRCGNGT
jgi:hypothetical protein